MTAKAARVRAAQQAYDAALRQYVVGWGVVHEAFRAELAAAESIIRGPRDRRPEARAARVRVRSVLQMFGNPPDELREVTANLDRAEHRLRELALQASDRPSSPPLEA